MVVAFKAEGHIHSRRPTHISAYPRQTDSSAASSPPSTRSDADLITATENPSSSGHLSPITFFVLARNLESAASWGESAKRLWLAARNDKQGPELYLVAVLFIRYHSSTPLLLYKIPIHRLSLVLGLDSFPRRRAISDTLPPSARHKGPCYSQRTSTAQ